MPKGVSTLLIACPVPSSELPNGLPVCHFSRPTADVPLATLSIEEIIEHVGIAPGCIEAPGQDRERVSNLSGSEHGREILLYVEIERGSHSPQAAAPP